MSKRSNCENRQKLRWLAAASETQPKLLRETFKVFLLWPQSFSPPSNQRPFWLQPSEMTHQDSNTSYMFSFPRLGWGLPLCFRHLSQSYAPTPSLALGISASALWPPLHYSGGMASFFVHTWFLVLVSLISPSLLTVLYTPVNVAVTFRRKAHLPPSLPVNTFPLWPFNSKYSRVRAHNNLSHVLGFKILWHWYLWTINIWHLLTLDFQKAQPLLQLFLHVHLFLYL